MIGLDLSLNSTGIAFFENGRLVTTRVICTSYRGPRRLWFVRQKVSEYLDRAKPDFAAIEGYSMGRRGQRGNTFSIAELGGVIQTLLWEKGVDFISIPPTTMKSIIALSGSAEKHQISAALQEHYGLTVNQNDEADAAGLLIVGELKCGVRRYLIEKQAHRIKSLAKLSIVPGRLKSISTGQM